MFDAFKFDVLKFAAVLLLALGLVTAAHAEEQGSLPACGEIPGTPSKKPKPLWKMVPLVSILTKLEERGEAEFRLAWSSPSSQCLVETLDVNGTAFSAVHAKFRSESKDDLGDRLIYRFAGGDGAGSRDVVVLLDLLSSVITDVHLIYVAEMRGGHISYYAMFDGLPAYDKVRETAVGILGGSVKPIAVVHWEPGAKEGTIDYLDDRLKN